MKTKEQLRAERLWQAMLAKSFDPVDWYLRDEQPEWRPTNQVERPSKRGNEDGGSQLRHRYEQVA